jgi:uncharacterized protein YkwD
LKFDLSHFLFYNLTVKNMIRSIKFIYFISLLLLVILITDLGCDTERRMPRNSQVSVEKEEEMGKLSPPKLDIGILEIRVHDLTNIERQKRGLPLLKIDNKLSEIARRHSEDMARRGFFNHVNPEGQDPTGRAKAARYPIRRDFGNYYTIGIGENIFQNSLYDSAKYINGVLESYNWNSLEKIANFTVEGWMNSPGHRKNILDSKYDREGIGVAISSDMKVLITQNFW